MSIQQKRQCKFATFMILPVILVLAALASAFLSSNAEATNDTDLTKVSGYVKSYISNQYGSGEAQGEAGFLVDAATLYNNLGGGTGIPGEGTDAATIPVLVDNYGSNGTWIPGTSIRCFWNTGADGSGATQNCFDASVVDAIKAKVDAHAAAGFSTDVIFYCVSGHTEAPTTGGMGYLAQAPNGLGTGITPRVLALKWGRNGWTNTIASYPNSGPLAAPNPPSTYTPPTSVPAASACNSSSSQGDAELMRCQAQWAIYNGTVNGMTGGNVGNGQNPNTTAPNSAASPALTTGQVVDIRAGGITQTVSGYNAVSISLDTLFGSGLAGVNPNATNGALVASRTPMVGGIAAMGLKMLGYTTSTGGFNNGGIPKWNNSLDEKQVSDGQTRPALTSTPIDTTAPEINNIKVATDSGNHPVITWNTNEPATSIVEYSDDGGNTYAKVTTDCDKGGAPEPCTVLRGSHSLTVKAITGTSYLFKVTSYDGLANGATAVAEGDFTPPTVANVGACITTGCDYGFTASYNDPSPSNGIDTVSIVVKVAGEQIYPADGNKPGKPNDAPCWAIGSNSASSGTITCSTPYLNAAPPGGSYPVEVSITDKYGNSGSATGSLTVTGVRDPLLSTDSTKPTTTPKHSYGSSKNLGDWQNADFSVALTCSDGRLTAADGVGSGCKETWFKVDDSDWAKGNAAMIQYAEGNHTIKYYSADNKGNAEGTQAAPKTVEVKLDKTGPEITGMDPADGGRVSRSPGTISVNFADQLSGIKAGTMQVVLDGTVMENCTTTETSISCPAPADLGKGRHAVDVSVSDNALNITNLAGAFYIVRNYYWTWYDSASARNWVLMANPSGAASDLNFELAIGGQKRNLAPFAIRGLGAGQVPKGQTITPLFGGLMGGPVKVTSLNGGPAIVSQRSLWGDSFDEVPGVDEESLSDHYYWTWYDQLSPGFRNWVLIANPGGSAVTAEIKVAGVRKWQGTINPGQNVTPQFPGTMGGPVEVIASGKVIASQRVLSNNGGAFNEEPGIPAEELRSQYLWTWYDMTGGARNWVLIANPGGSPVTAEIKIAGVRRWQGTINPGQNVTPTFPGAMGGPVEVIASDKVIASQRVLWGPSFEETPGLRTDGQSPDYHWTWYDQTGNAKNWVLIANPTGGATDIYYEILIGGKRIKTGGPIKAGNNDTPWFPGTMGGPVEVKTYSDASRQTPAGAIASQRVLWNGYFNEVMGQVLN